MTNDTVVIWKPQGWTPLMAVEAFKKKYPVYKEETVSYAGRLDPMAEGVLLLLVGEANKRRKEYEGLKKVYESEIVFGITTDSLDALGLVLKSGSSNVQSGEVERVLVGFVGRKDQSYPIYSSRTVNGKRLYWWARAGRISEIKVPTKTIFIHSIRLVRTRKYSTENLGTSIQKKIKRVSGNFRQEEIIKTWTQFVKTHQGQSFTCASMLVSCSSGTYIRKLVSDIGDKLGCGAFALSITRTHVGVYSRKDCISI